MNQMSQNEVMQPTTTRQVERLRIILGSWKSRFKIFGFKYLWNQ